MAFESVLAYERDAGAAAPRSINEKVHVSVVVVGVYCTCVTHLAYDCRPFLGASAGHTAYAFYLSEELVTREEISLFDGGGASNLSEWSRGESARCSWRKYDAGFARILFIREFDFIRVYVFFPFVGGNFASSVAVNGGRRGRFLGFSIKH